MVDKPVPWIPCDRLLVGWTGFYWGFLFWSWMVDKPVPWIPCDRLLVGWTGFYWGFLFWSWMVDKPVPTLVLMMMVTDLRETADWGDAAQF
jgi:hypothetical protein